MCKNNNRLISDEQKILQTISLQDYVKRLWNHSNTKIPVTIGKGTDTAKPRSKAPHAGQWQTKQSRNISCMYFSKINALITVTSSKTLSLWGSRESQQKLIIYRLKNLLMCNLGISARSTYTFDWLKMWCIDWDVPTKGSINPRRQVK